MGNGRSDTHAPRLARGQARRLRTASKVKPAGAAPKAVTIRAHLLLLVLIVLLPAAVAAIWIIDRTYRAEQQLMERNLKDTTRALSMVVDAELSKRAAVAGMLSDLHLLDAGARTDADDLQRFGQLARRAVGQRRRLGGTARRRACAARHARCRPGSCRSPRGARRPPVQPAPTRNGRCCRRSTPPSKPVAWSPR